MIFVILCPKCKVDNIVPKNLSTPTVCLKCGENLVTPSPASELAALPGKHIDS